MNFYAYVHARPRTVDASGIFYVGKGCGARATVFHHRNLHHTRITEKHGIDNILVGVIPCSSEDIAFELEKGLIKCLKRAGVKLSNLTDGGEGLAGLTRTDDFKSKVSAATRKNWKNEEIRAKMTKGIREVSNVIGAKSKESWTPERRLEHAKAVSARYEDSVFRLNASKKASDFQSSLEYREAMRVSVSRAWGDPKLRAKQRANMLGRVWITNGSECRRVSEHTVSMLEELGWKRGRVVKMIKEK